MPKFFTYKDVHADTLNPPAHDAEYIRTVADVLENGHECFNDRTQKEMFKQHGKLTRYNTMHGIPLFTHKKVNHDAVNKELTWFMRGETNIKTLGCGIWDLWADENGELGAVYGQQMRNQEFFKLALTEKEEAKLQSAGYSYYGKVLLERDQAVDRFGAEFVANYDHTVELMGLPYNGEYPCMLYRKQVDQLSDAMQKLKDDPYDRRNIVMMWNNADLGLQALPPCHMFFQFLVRPATEWDITGMLAEQRITDLLSVFPDDAEKGWAHVEKHFDYGSFINELHEMHHYKTYDHPDNSDYDPSASKVFAEWIRDFTKYEYTLDLLFYMRSNDKLLGEPFNVASYATLLTLAAQHSHMCVGDTIHATADSHLYREQIEHENFPRLVEQMKATMQEESYKVQYPRIRVVKFKENIWDYRNEDIQVLGYTHKPFVKLPVAQ